MASPVSYRLSPSPVPTPRLEDQYPPLMRALYNALSAFVEEIESERLSRLPAFLRCSEEQSRRQTCDPIGGANPTFVCEFRLNSLRCACVCQWIREKAFFSFTLSELSDDFLERSVVYLEFLNRSGLKPSMTAKAIDGVLNCSWEISSPEELENALSTFEDLFEPARWPEELADAYFRGGRELPLHCSRVDATKKVQEIILTLDVFAKLIEKNVDLPHLPVCVFSCSASPDPQVQYRIAGLFQTLIRQGKGFQEASKSAFKMIDAPETKHKCVGVAILTALAEKGFFSPNSLDTVAHSFKKNINLEFKIRNFIAELLDKGHVKEVLAKAIESFNSLNEVTRRFALILFEELFKKRFGFENAKKQVFPLFLPSPQAPRSIMFSVSHPLTRDQDRPRTIDQNKLKLLLLLVEHGQFQTEAMEKARELFRSKHYMEAEHGLAIYRALILSKKGADQAAEDAALRFESKNILDKGLAIQLFRALVRKGKAYKFATEFAVKAFKSSEYDLMRAGFDLLLILMSKGEAINETMECAIEASDQTKPQKTPFMQKAMMQAGFDLLVPLVEKGKATEIAKKRAAEAIVSSDPDQLDYGLKLYTALVKRGLVYKEAAKAAVDGTSDQKALPFVKCAALSLFTELVRQGKSVAKARKALQSLSDTEDSTISSACNGLSKALEKALASAHFS